MGTSDNRHSTQQELQIVEAFSSVKIPEQIVRQSNIKQLINDMSVAQQSVQSTSDKLEHARRQQKDGNFIGNWWNDRGDAVQDAQLDLNKSIGNLTQKSSQLLIVNTAISKVLHDQQAILLQQQNLLKSQTDILQQQNQKIFEQQQRLEEQQTAINAANEGLLEVTGVSQAQAKQLIGCVVRVSEAEDKIDAANLALSQEVERRLQQTSKHCLESLSTGFEEIEQRWTTSEQQLQTLITASQQQFQSDYATFIEQSREINIQQQQALQTSMADFAGQMTSQQAAVQKTEAGLVSQMQEIQRTIKSTRQNHLVSTIALTSLSLAALTWLAGLHFGFF